MRTFSAKDVSPLVAEVKNGFKNFIWEEWQEEGDWGKINRNIYHYASTSFSPLSFSFISKNIGKIIVPEPHT